MENNPLILYHRWFKDQYIVWADRIAAAAMDSFDALYEESIRIFGASVEEAHSFIPPDGRSSGIEEMYVRGTHALRLLSYIEQTVAKRNVGITALIASLLFEVTEDHKPSLLGEAQYQKELDQARSRYHQAMVADDQDRIAACEGYLKTLEEDQEARRFMNETWKFFSKTSFNLHTIAAFEAV